MCWGLDVLGQSVLCSDLTPQLTNIWYWCLLPHHNFHMNTLILVLFFVHLFIIIWEVEGSLHLSSSIWCSLIFAQVICSLHCSLHYSDLVSVKVCSFVQSFLRLFYVGVRAGPVKYVSRFCTKTTGLWKMIWSPHTEQERKNVGHRAKHTEWGVCHATLLLGKDTMWDWEDIHTHCSCEHFCIC